MPRMRVQKVGSVVDYPKQLWPELVCAYASVAHSDCRGYVERPSATSVELKLLVVAY
jgi:hypothetical protein